MTYREISIAFENINRRTHNDMAFQANLHGAKAKYKQGKSEKAQQQLDPETEKKVQRAMGRAIERNKWQKKT